MDKVLAVIKREYLERVRSKWFLVATIFGPLMMAVLIILPAWLASRTRPSTSAGNIVILDATGTGLGERVATLLRSQGGSPVVRAVTGSALAAAESTAVAEVMARPERGDGSGSESTQGYLVVDQLTAAGERARYAGRNASTIPDMERLEAAIRQSVLAARFEAAGLDAQRVQALSSIRLDLSTERLTERGRGGSGRGNVALAYAIALLLYMSIVLYGQAILMGVIEEKTQRVAEVVVASISPGKLLAGKVAGVGSVGLTQQLVWVLSALLMLRFRGQIMGAMGLPAASTMQLPSVSPGTALAFLCFFILGYTFFATLFAAAGSMVSSTQDAQQVATPLTLLIVPSVLLLTPVLLEPNGTLSRVVSLLPFTSPILMPVRMSLTGVPWFEVAGAIVLLVLTCLGAIWVAARIYRVGVLMYGKKPSLAELGRWVRYPG
ncbi:MAG: ABC transporter permease [Gemmatimonadota bacterium]